MPRYQRGPPKTAEEKLAYQRKWWSEHPGANAKYQSVYRARQKEKAARDAQKLKEQQEASAAAPPAQPQ